jgi:hypothetical protein
MTLPVKMGKITSVAQAPTKHTDAITSYGHLLRTYLSNSLNAAFSFSLYCFFFSSGVSALVSFGLAVSG